MSIVEKASEISENNATIAKNQQRVYEAGVRAGLAQDPDYAEGYKDGHTQGLSDASGVIWEDLISGEIPVGKAREADHAAEASHSANADRASIAGRATEAAHAATATNSGHSASADRAAEADHAATAANATLADRATNADNADRAALAGHATSATRANSAAKADKAGALEEVLSIEGGGTGANTVEGALGNLGLTGVAKIQAGSYVGTGTYNSNNPNSLTFDFVPKLVFVQAESHVDTYLETPHMFMINGINTTSVLHVENVSSVGTDRAAKAQTIYVYWSDKTVRWHNNVRADFQLNLLDKKYLYVAIG